MRSTVLHWLSVVGEDDGNWSVGHYGMLEFRIPWGSGLHEYQQITLLKVVHLAGTKSQPCESQRNHNCYVTHHVVVSGPHFSWGDTYGVISPVSVVYTGAKWPWANAHTAASNTRK